MAVNAEIMEGLAQLLMASSAGTSGKRGGRDSGRPEWIRLPTKGVEHYSGLTRPVIYGLIHDGKVESRVHKQPGKKTGVRLVRLSSLLDFLDSLPEEGGS